MSSATITVSPEQFSEIHEIANRASRTIDGSFNEGVWIAGLSELFGRETVLSWVGSPVLVVVDWDRALSIPLDLLQAGDNPNAAHARMTRAL